MQSVMRIVCIAYLIFLTALLLTSDPMRLVGVRNDWPFMLHVLMPAAHFLSFFVLAVLTLMVRWPVPRWGIAALLMLYAGMTEIAQSFTYVRKAEWVDWLQDLGGIAVGVVFCWIMAYVGGALVTRKQESKNCDLPGTPGEWDVVRNVMSRPPITRNQSWWG